MTEQVELLLVDGPGAGQRVRHHSDWATYIHVTYPDWPVLSFDAADTMTFAGPIHTPYRIGHAYGLDRQIIRVGWSSGKPEPDREEVEYWIRYEPPVKVIAGADAYPFGCDFGVEEDQVGATIQGVCQCGWKTQAVPRRRTRELMELVGAHEMVGMALTFRASGIDVSAAELNPALLGTHSLGQATRYEAASSRATAVGMSREQAHRIFRNAETVSYSFDDAIERLEHRIRLFTMYGYLPLAVRDVLTRREIDTRRIDPDTLLNRPRWMPNPLGRQFAEASHNRQRSLVAAALAVADDLGGDAAGWPLERALAAVMPCREDA
jgi:hypothetical protein